MKRATTLFVMFIIAGWQLTTAQSTEYVFNPERTGELTDPFPVGSENGARGLSGPYDLDQDGQLEMLVGQHVGAGGVIHVIENTGTDTWELVYSTALLDSTTFDYNARFAQVGDLDSDGNLEIIYVGGNDYSQDDVAWPIGMYVWEHDGVVGSDNYGTSPATVGAFFDLDQELDAASVFSQNFRVQDVDGDDIDEVLVALNGNSAHDVFYIMSLTGDIETNGYGNTFESWTVEAKEAPRNRDVGGGSPYGIYPGDFNGDGNTDIAFHTWNYFNFFNYTTTGPDAYVPAPEGSNLAATDPDDHVALFGGVIVDIDGDGNDEGFFPNYYSGSTAVMNYDDGEDVTTVDTDHFAVNEIATDAAFAGPVDAGDSDGDGQMELLVGTGNYGLTARNNGEPSFWLHIAEFGGGDPMDGANYSVTPINTASELDTLDFNFVIRDSLGTVTSYREVAGFGMFTTGVAYMGDADGDGNTEVGLSFQGVDDSLFVYDEVWNPDAGDAGEYERTVREKVEAHTRPMLRIISLDGTATARENRLVVPSDYKLSSNYPNPFNPSTTFSITLPIDKAVSVRVYDIQGRLVRTLVDNQHYQQGTYEIRWDGTNSAGVSVASGTYLYTLEYGNFRQTKKMVLLK